jgi:hypothetical protein
MWNMPFSVGVTAATVDFTADLSWLMTGLAGVMLLSVMAIVLTAVNGRKDERLLRTAILEDESYREAA